MSYDPEVADRVRRVLADQAGVAEQKMVGGGLSFLVITVEPAGFAADDALAGWVQRGLDFAAGQPAKPER